MRILLVVLMLVLGCGFEAYSQNPAKKSELVYWYETLSLNDVDKIRSEISNYPTYSVSKVCYNHSVIVISSDGSVREPHIEIGKILSDLKTSSAPLLKEGDSSGLICETEVPSWMKQQSEKQ